MTKKRKAELIQNYLYQAVGKTWNVGDVQLEISETGSKVIPGYEVTRMTNYVANEICCAHGALTGSELEYLCDLTDTKYSFVAEKVGLTKSVVSKWVDKENDTIPFAPSIILKKYFWFKIFGLNLVEPVPPELLFNDDKLFDFLKKKAS